MGVFVPAALSIIDTTPPVLFARSPSGTATVPTAVTVGQPFTFSAIIGEDTALNTNPYGNATCGNYPGFNCVTFASYYATTPVASGNNFIRYSWVGGVLSTQVCNFSASCTPSFTQISSASCNNMAFCYQISVAVAAIPAALQGDYFSLNIVASDINRNNIQPGASQAFVSAPGVVPTGYFFVNGQRANDASTILATTNSIPFQFNATAGANNIVNINIIVVNATTSTTKTLCYVGTGCFAPTASSPTFLFPPWNLYFTNGQYNVTANVVTSSASIRVLSLIGGFGVSPISLPVFGLGTLLAIFGGIMIASDLGIAVVRRKS